MKESKDKEKQDEQALCKLVDKHFKEAKKHRETFEEEWKECEDFYNGKHWKDKNRSFKNIVFPIVEQEVATLTDGIPSTDLLARNEEREEDVKMLEASIHFTYEMANLFLKTAQVERAALKVGTGFQYIDFDPDADGGQGLTTIKTIPWRQVFLDPAATDIDEAAFVGLKIPMRVSEIKRRFPKHADKIQASLDSTDNDSYSSSTGSRSETHDLMSGDDSNDRFKIDGMATLEEAWLRDYTMVKVPEEETASEIAKETEEIFNGINPDIGRHEDHPAHIPAHEAQLQSMINEGLLKVGINPADARENDIKEMLEALPDLALRVEVLKDHIKIHKQYMEVNPKGERPKYSEGLRLVMKVGSVVLYDGDPPVDDGMVPLVPYYCYKDDESIWGTGEVKNIIPAQKSYNTMDHAELKSLLISSNPWWEIDADSGIKPQDISNREGLVLVKKPGSVVRRGEPGQTSPQLSMRKAADQQAMEIISGINEASQGRRPGGVTAAKAIERLQQQTNGRIRLKATMLALYSLPRLGRLVASRNAKYWTTERFMRVSDSSTGEVKLVKWDPERIKDIEYDVRVVPGSLAGTDKEAQAEVMAAYVEKGWIPPKVYFQVVDVPNKRKVLEALEENDQQKALMEQLAAENEQLKAMIQGVQGGTPPTAPEATTMEAPAINQGI